jgi:hypothetical protein
VFAEARIALTAAGTAGGIRHGHAILGRRHLSDTDDMPAPYHWRFTPIRGGPALYRRVVAVALCAAFLLATAAPAEAFRAHLNAPTHHPKAGKAWRIKVTARTRSGRAVRAKATYKFIYNGQVVATRYPSPRNKKCPNRGERHKPWRFKGSYRDTICWPRRSVGIRLKFRVVVKAQHHKHHLDYKVRVKR